VVYGPGRAVDQPLSVTRYAYRDRPGTGQPTCPSPGDTTSARCVLVQWPLLRSAYDRNRGGLVWPSWQGSLLEAKRDGSGWEYTRARVYDPQTGRFTQEDPIGLAGGLNLYGFAHGDPINFDDPFGLMPCPPFCDPEDYKFLSDQPGAYQERLPLAGVAVAGAGLGLATVRAGLALMARFAPAAAGVGAAAGRIPFAEFQQWGRDVVQWGRTASGAIERAAEITAEQAAKLDPAKVRQALDFHRNAVEAGKGGAAAPERVRLMERILELQQRQP
jgi:RHS repeat-associated protein